MEIQPVQSLPENFEYAKLVYVQLHLCLRALDALGLELPAAHLDSSIQALRNEIEKPGGRSNLDLTLSKDFSGLDELIAQMFLPQAAKQ